MNTRRISRAAQRRWATASDLLRVVHAEPGITRTGACDRLGLASGAATELIERLRADRLLSERPARRTRPGRPTTVLDAHPQGPLVAVVDLRTTGWRVLLGDLAGAVREVASGSYGDEEPAEFLPRIATNVSRIVNESDGRVRVVSAVVAGTVAGTRLLEFATRGWTGADLGVLIGGLPGTSGVRLLAGNDATLGGLAEARTGAARHARVALHILVAVGVGGALLVDGQPMTGTRGAGGEYGHLPFGDPDLACPCGARGCWDLMVDGRALARALGEESPADPVDYARRVLARSGEDARASRAVASVAHSLGSGVAGLVNLHDPDVVTLGGMAPAVRAAAPDAFARAFRDGLMTFHREAPPPVLDGLHGDAAPVLGALSLGMDEAVSPAGLAEWTASPGRSPSR